MPRQQTFKVASWSSPVRHDYRIKSPCIEHSQNADIWAQPHMSVTGSYELFLRVCDGSWNWSYISSVCVISIQSKWDISFSFRTNPLVKYKINTRKWPLSLTDSKLENCSELLDVTGLSVFKWNLPSSGQKKASVKGGGLWVPSSIWGLPCSASSSYLTQGSAQRWWGVRLQWWAVEKRTPSLQGVRDMGLGPGRERVATLTTWSGSQGLTWQERSDFCKLSSDLQLCIMTLVCVRTHTHIHTTT